MSEGRPLYEVLDAFEKDTPPDKLNVATRLRALADNADAIGIDMGHLGEVGYRVLGNSLIDRAGVFRAWADDIERDAVAVATHDGGPE